MKNTYIFIVNTEGKRQATYLVQKESEIEALRRKAATEYPDCINFVGHDMPDFDAFAAGKLYVDGKYVDPPPVVPDLDEVKAAKIAEFKTIRDTKEVEPLQTDKGIFDYDDKSRDRLAIARQALTDAGGTGTVVWTTADNQRVPLGVADFAAINAAAAERSNALHVLYNELKTQVNACETVEEVEAIVWPEV